MNKAVAVQDDLAHRTTVITVDTRMLLDPADASALFADHDLVIDASANGAVTAMLGRAADTFGTTLLSVCVQNDGDTTRVDLIPPLAGDPLPPSPQRKSATDPFFEGGCGDPVSPTPPHAVIDAAALAARHAIGLLAATPLDPAGEIRNAPPTASAP